MKRLLLLLFISIITISLWGQTIARFEADAGNTDRRNAYVNAHIKNE